MVSSTPRPQFTPGKNPVPILQEAGWAPGPVWTGGKSRPHRDSIPDRPARSQSPYRLSHPAQSKEISVYHYLHTAWKEVKQLLYMIKHAIKKYGGVRVQLHSFISLVVNGGQYHTLPALSQGNESPSSINIRPGACKTV